MRRLVLMMMLGACSSGTDYGFAVAVTIHFGFDPSAVDGLDLFVDGDEPNQFHKMPPAGGHFHTEERWVYQPLPTSKSLVISAAARTGTEVVGAGSVGVKLLAGQTKRVTLDVDRVAPPPDLSSEDASPADLGGGSEQDLLPASCTLAGCATLKKGCDPAVGCVSCLPPGAGNTQFYVDGNSFPEATGTPNCPFNTITQGINAAAISPVTSMKTVHVAAGSYGPGETFPIQLAGNVTLDGAGIGKTVIVGTGTDPTTLASGPPTVMTAPSPTQVSALSHLTLRPSGGIKPVGLLCYGGNADKVYNGVHSPASTLVDGVEFTGYDVGAMLRSQNDGVTPGCNLLLTGSSIHDGTTGLVAYGCDSFHTKGLNVSVRVGAVNMPATGNSFYALSSYASLVNDCTAYAYFYENDIHHSLAGLSFYSNFNTGLDIENNRLHDLTSIGLLARGATFIALLTTNTFTNIGGVTPPSSGTTCHGSAICLDDNSQLGVGTGNSIINNDRGLEIAGNSFSGSRQTINFGDGMSFGGENTFSCNSNGTDGHDVWVHFVGSTNTNPLYIAGNHWDRTVLTRTAMDGSDLFAPSPAPVLNTAPIQSPTASDCKPRSK